jgi:integrase
MRVFIPEQIKPHIYRLQNGDNKEWWMPQLHQWKDKNYASQKMNLSLRRWQKKEGIDLDFTLYAARHSWAQYARDLGYDLASVNECLAHKDNLEMGRIYASLTWEQKNEINQKVIDSFVWF